uniref:Uncharacterized protein n=1 Tax=Capra hircus TaxID=9925 RepID=A0A8C2RWP7_CAPHI
VEDDAAAREEGVPVAVHQHALHDRLRQVPGPGTGAAHLPLGTPARLASPRGGTAVAPAASPHTRGAGSRPETNPKQTSPRVTAKQPRAPGVHRAETLPLQDSPGTFKWFTRVCTTNQRSPCAHTPVSLATGGIKV